MLVRRHLTQPRKGVRSCSHDSRDVQVAKKPKVAQPVPLFVGRAQSCESRGLEQGGLAKRASGVRG